MQNEASEPQSHRDSKAYDTNPDERIHLGTREQVAIPVVEESVHTNTRLVETEEVRVRTTVEESVQPIEADLNSVTVNVKRVPVGKVVEAPPAPRTEGNTTIIPVVEERVIVRTEWVLVEEIHVERIRTVEKYESDVPLRRTRVEVERIPLPRPDQSDQSNS